MKQKTCYIFLIFLFSFTSLPARTLHLLLLGDTHKKSEIRRSVRRDLANCEQSFAHFTHLSNIEIRSTYLTTKKNNLSNEHILKWLNELEINAHDMIIIYYSGHGFRTVKTKTLLPMGETPTHKKRKGKKLDFQNILISLIGKKADLNIILLDCCNTFRPEKNQPNFNHDDTSSDDQEEFYNSFSLQRMKEMYKDPELANGFSLLFRKKGIIVACAASPGEIARGRNGDQESEYYARSEDETIGGVFTRTFLLNFFKECSVQNPSWVNILKKTKEDTIQESKQVGYHLYDEDNESPFHTPVYGIYIGDHKRSSKTYLNFLMKDIKSKDLSHNEDLIIENNLDIHSIYLMPSL